LSGCAGGQRCPLGGDNSGKTSGAPGPRAAPGSGSRCPQGSGSGAHLAGSAGRGRRCQAPGGIAGTEGSALQVHRERPGPGRAGPLGPGCWGGGRVHPPRPSTSPRKLCDLQALYVSTRPYSVPRSSAASESFTLNNSLLVVSRNRA
jgi:hypothetical protein